MSGGSMDYIYSKLKWSIPTKETIDNDPYLDKDGKELAKACVDRLNEAVIIAKRLEWFISADDSAESFKRRLKEELGYDLLNKE